MGARWLYAAVAACSSVACAQPAPERFMMGNVPDEGGRWGPNPIWVTIPWENGKDALFREIRDEVTPVVMPANWQRGGGVWSAKAKQAYADWYADHQNAVKLYKASAYVAVALFTDPKFEESKDYTKLKDTLNIGFSVLRSENIPPSYEFCRRAYIEKTGDSHYHLFRNLGKRLLERDPADRSVATAMVREYMQRRAEPDFEKAMFDGLFAAAKTARWLPWDDHWIAKAMCKYGRQHNKKSYYDKAIPYMDRCIQNTPRGINPKPMKELRAIMLKERDLPNFGMPEIGKKGG